jgi:hypothetical protein
MQIGRRKLNHFREGTVPIENSGFRAPCTAMVMTSSALDAVHTAAATLAHHSIADLET